MDPNSIFGLFDSEPENRKKESEKEITNLSEHPYVLMGLFTRMILRGEESTNNSLEFLKMINPEVDLDAILQVNKALIYVSGYNHLYKLSLEDPLHREVLLEKAGEDFLKACERSIQFFSALEEYEKCAFIKKFYDFINFSQNKLPL